MKKEIGQSTIEKQWKYKGLPCMVILNKYLKEPHRCGYVGVPKKHIAFGKEHSDIDLVVHGGLTFAAMGKEKTHWKKGYYWLGFDLAHSGDTTNYWTLERVVRETEWLANELIDLKEVNTFDYKIKEFINETSIKEFKKFKKEVK